MLKIQLFGKVEITVSGVPLPALRGKSGLWLLGVLTLNANRTIERDRLAEILWPDSAPEQGRANLRRALTDVRQALGAAARRLTNPTQHTVLFEVAIDEADVLAFRGGVWERYGGELLPGCSLEWVETERRALAEQFLTQGEKRAAEIASAESLLLLERLRAADPLRESLLRLQLTALCRLGNRAEAQQIYHSFRRTLLEGRLGEPSAQTQSHWKALQSENVEASPVAAVAYSKSARLPTPLTPLLGRVSEQETLVRLLSEHRLVTLTGLGGIGKTRLAIEVAREFPPAIWRELADCPDAERLTEMLQSFTATDLSKAEGSEGFPLLILDNFEQLAGAKANHILRSLLEKYPDLRCLVTSRRALGLMGERLLALEPLELPQHPGSPERLGEFASFRLLVERAQALRPDFQVTGQNAEALVALCQQSEGIPLALELLAAHLRSLTPEALTSQVRKARLPMLARRDEGEIPRHQSLWRIIESSLALLRPHYRDGFAMLSVFRGGWTLEAAQAVGASMGLGSVETIALLETLEDNSLIRSHNTRYSQLETLREFALTIPKSSDQMKDLARRAHADFFLEFAERNASTPERLVTLDTEQDNLRVAFDTLLENGDTASCLRWARAMHVYWYHRPGGQPLLERLLPLLQAADERAEIQNNLGVFSAMQANYPAAERYFGDALRYFESVGDTFTLAKMLSNYASMEIERGDEEKARRLLEQALPLWRDLNQPRGLGVTLNSLSIVTMNQGDFNESECMIEEALALREAQGDSYGIAIALVNRASLYLRRGARREAEVVSRDALRRFQEIGDRRGEATCLESLTEVYLDENRHGEAARFLQEAAWLRREYNLPITELHNRLHSLLALAEVSLPAAA